MPPPDDAPALPVERVRVIRRRLLRWYDAERRDLPWRRTADPYAIWLSEVMLQQTRVDTVIPYFERFLARFPTLSDLACAPLDDVLALWSGLGYYRRARSLHAAASTMVREHAGRFPDRLEDALALPGVGRYTAGAVLSIAHGKRHPVVDGNVERVIGRLFALGEGTPKRRFWEVASELVPPSRPGDFNQALMELGSEVCTPREPACERCTVRASCSALRLGRPEDFPARGVRPDPVAVTRALAVARRAGRLLFWRREATVLRGVFEFPGVDIRPHGDPGEAVSRHLELEVGVGFEPGDALPPLRHSVMNRRITALPVLGEVAGRVPRRVGPRELRWILPSRLDEHPTSGLAGKVVRALRI